MTEESRKSASSIHCLLSNDIVKLYNFAAVQNANEAVTVVLHAFLLESGFIPKDVENEDKYRHMPEKWNENNMFKFKYAHYCCPSYTCCMTCVPLYSTISIHGIICDVDCRESVDFKLNVNKYVQQKDNFSDVFEVFCNLDELSRLFKDNFCLPLLNLLHETIGKDPLYGMPGLLDELKLYILRYLPVESVISMSAVNKSFNLLANSSMLWKYLFQRDFSKESLLDIDDAASSETNWKQIYKKEHLKKKRKLEPRAYRFPRHRLPQIFSVGPDYGFGSDIGINFDPPFPDMYPPFLPPGLPFSRLLP